jgi:flagellar FliL protein
VPENNDEQELTSPPTKRRASFGKVMIILLLALASSAGGGIIAFVLINRTMSAQARALENPDKAREAEQERIAAMLEKSAVLPLEPFVVNLADSDAARYLRIKINLLVDDKSKVAQITFNQPLQLKLRDVILESLTTKTSQDLINEEGKKKLRREIQDKLALYFREPKLVDVMFTEFVIQL